MDDIGTCPLSWVAIKTQRDDLLRQIHKSIADLQNVAGQTAARVRNELARAATNAERDDG